MSSRPRNSTLLDVLIAALLALAALVAFTGGFDIEWGPLSLRSHSPWRVLAIALVPIGLRAWRSAPGARMPDLVRLGLLTLTLLSVGYWFKYLLTSVGGADSYGYASAARQLASGRLIDPAPMAAWLSSPNRLALVAALGWAPAASGDGIVPTYPLGLPALMAVFSTIAGSNAIYLVAPVMGALTLWLVFRLARSMTDPRTAWLATALVAWNPVFLTYAKQPMSDVPATAWLLLAFCLVQLKPDATSMWNPALAGFAAGAAFLTRPALIVAAAIVPLLSMRWVAGIGVAAAVILQASLQAYLFGSPFASGYGSAEQLFSVQALFENVDIYARQSWAALGGLWIGALAAGAWFLRGPRATRILALATAVALPYLFYKRFDHWETLRFLLPAIVPLSILVAAGVTGLAARVRAPAAIAIAVLAFAGLFAWRSERFMRESSVWAIHSLEQRYPLAGQWFDVNAPSQSVVLASQHSGSLRWYGGRQTIRWDVMTPAELVPTVRELEGHGATVYAALEGSEQQAFDARFAAELPHLRVDPVGRVHNVGLLRLQSRGPRQIR
jgi:hypothetical protein